MNKKYDTTWRVCNRLDIPNEFSVLTELMKSVSLDFASLGFLDKSKHTCIIKQVWTVIDTDKYPRHTNLPF